MSWDFSAAQLHAIGANNEHYEFRKQPAEQRGFKHKQLFKKSAKLQLLKQKWTLHPYPEP